MSKYLVISAVRADIVDDSALREAITAKGKVKQIGNVSIAELWSGSWIVSYRIR